MLERVKYDTVRKIFAVQPAREAPEQAEPVMFFNKNAAPSFEGPDRKERKVGRNDPCPCGSGKKYKKCCGK